MVIVVAGGHGVGKTTFVSSISDTGPRNVEATTDFGRINLHPRLVLYLFGTSDPRRFGSGGVLGAVVLVDARRVEDASSTIAYLQEGSAIPFIVAVNMFDGELAYELDEVREALALGPDVPLTTCDARDGASAKQVLQKLVSLALKAGTSDHTAPPDDPPV